jgi:GAF domain-containing protein
MTAVDFYPAEDAEKLVKEGVPAALKAGSWTAEANLLKVDGTTIPVEETIGINYDTQGNPVGFSITMRDVTERKQADLERERLLAELQAAYRQFVQREWSQFLSEQRGGSWHVEYRQGEKELAMDGPGHLPEVARNGDAGETQMDPKSKSQNLKSKLEASIALRGQEIGTLSLEDINPNRRWTPEEKALVETISEQLAQTVENLRLFGDTQQQAARERLTREITDKMRESPDIDSIIHTGLTELARALGVPRTYVKLTPKPDQFEAAEAGIERARVQLKQYGHKGN